MTNLEKKLLKDLIKLMLDKMPTSYVLDYLDEIGVDYIEAKKMLGID